MNARQHRKKGEGESIIKLNLNPLIVIAFLTDLSSAFTWRLEGKCDYYINRQDICRLAEVELTLK